jgi:hypothetical protein
MLAFLERFWSSEFLAGRCDIELSPPICALGTAQMGQKPVNYGVRNIIFRCSATPECASRVFLISTAI